MLQSAMVLGVTPHTHSVIVFPLSTISRGTDVLALRLALGRNSDDIYSGR